MKVELTALWIQVYSMQGPSAMLRLNDFATSLAAGLKSRLTLVRFKVGVSGRTGQAASFTRPGIWLSL
jgi:hypothetical protein